MATGDPGMTGLATSTLPSRGSSRALEGRDDQNTTQVIVTEVCPFHCLYQDALEFHSQSRLMLARSESAACRLARASLLLYVSSAEALIHQAAVELGRPELTALVLDPARPLPTLDVWKLLPAIVGTAPAIDASTTPWPQLAELLSLRSSLIHPGPARSRRAFYRASKTGSGYEPLLPHQAPRSAGIPKEALVYPRTGLPRDPYALRPHHLDTTRGVIDAAIDALDKKLDGALTRDNRHRREPTQILEGPAS